MGKHSNIILVDMTNGKIIDSIKRVSIDVNRIRQILPGKIYEYPPAQDKIPFKEITLAEMAETENTPKTLLSKIGGISPAIADDLATKDNPYKSLQNIIDSISSNTFISRIYQDENNVPKEFHIVSLDEFESCCTKIEFDSLSKCIDYYFDNKKSSNRARQKSHDLVKSVSTTLDKMYLKKQRLCEDVLKAENSEDLRLFGELLTANIHMVKTGDAKVEVVNYYDGTNVTIPLDVKYTPAKNAQMYYKKYGKSKTAIKEKQIQIQETEDDIQYLESVMTYLENTDSVEEIEALRGELIDTGYVRRRKVTTKEKKYKANPHQYDTSDGFHVLVGRNNKENDVLTLKTADNRDYWFHTKDIPGSHVVVQTAGRVISETAIFEAASIAAYHSKGRSSENVPVDYVLVKYVKKPAGAKPGMVIFTNNKTVWVNPKIPNKINLI